MLKIGEAFVHLFVTFIEALVDLLDCFADARKAPTHLGAQVSDFLPQAFDVLLKAIRTPTKLAYFSLETYLRLGNPSANKLFQLVTVEVGRVIAAQSTDLIPAIVE